MLAGVLLGLCFAPIKAIAFIPWMGLPIVLAWVGMGMFNRLFAVPTALAAFVLVMLFGVELPPGGIARITTSIVPDVTPIIPVFNASGLIGIALPLFIVTMASQNIPGTAVLRVNGYAPAPGPLFVGTGVFSLLGAPFGAHAVNLAAITAAMAAGPRTRIRTRPGATRLPSLQAPPTCSLSVHWSA